MSMYREPQSDRPQSPPINSSVAASFNSTASVRAVSLPTAASLNLSSGVHIFWNASGGGFSVSSYFGDICKQAQADWKTIARHRRAGKAARARAKASVPANLVAEMRQGTYRAFLFFVRPPDFHYGPLYRIY